MSSEFNLGNIQGDILGGLPKKSQIYFFFQIIDPAKFQTHLKTLIPHIKTVEGVIEDRKKIEEHKKKNAPGLLKMNGINIAFSHQGFAELKIKDCSLYVNEADPFFVGQYKDAVQNLGDTGVQTSDGLLPNQWDAAFTQPLHGLIMISGDSKLTVEARLADVELMFLVHTPFASIRGVTHIRGDVRPGDQTAHEHFGFLDGISNPAVIGFDKNPNPGPAPVLPGIIVTGHTGDPLQYTRAKWSHDGSYLSFRYLFQHVPEFNQYLVRNPIPYPGMTPEQGSTFLGARLMGRWKSGAPIDLAPFADDPALGADNTRNNDFFYAGEINSEVKCPFAAHLRKANPRDDLDDLPPPRGPIATAPHRIMRRGIAFGPEVSAEEKTYGHTKKERGLLFVAYSSDITNGFQFIQKTWANVPTFPPGQSSPVPPGLDPIIGQGNRQMSGTDPNDPTKVLTLPDFVIPRGGEYFFTPSISALTDVISATPST